MNKARRISIDNLVTKLNVIKTELEEVKSEEEYSYDSIPENLMYSSRAEISEEAINTMDESIDLLDEIIENLEGLL